MSELVTLARRYVSLSDELEAIRGEIRRVLLNGGAGVAENPTRPVRRTDGETPTLKSAKPAAEPATKPPTDTPAPAAAFKPTRAEVHARSHAAA
jgi:hypothetical protein